MIRHKAGGVEFILLDPDDDLPDDAPIGSRAMRSYPVMGRPPGSASHETYEMLQGGWVYVLEYGNMSEGAWRDHVAKELAEIKSLLKERDENGNL